MSTAAQGEGAGAAWELVEVASPVTEPVGAEAAAPDRNGDARCSAQRIVRRLCGAMNISLRYVGSDIRAWVRGADVKLEMESLNKFILFRWNKSSDDPQFSVGIGPIRPVVRQGFWKEGKCYFIGEDGKETLSTWMNSQ